MAISLKCEMCGKEWSEKCELSVHVLHFLNSSPAPGQATVCICIILKQAELHASLFKTVSHLMMTLWCVQFKCSRVQTCRLWFRLPTNTQIEIRIQCRYKNNTYKYTKKGLAGYSVVQTSDRSGFTVSGVRRCLCCSLVNISTFSGGNNLLAWSYVFFCWKCPPLSSLAP